MQSATTSKSLLAGIFLWVTRYPLIPGQEPSCVASNMLSRIKRKKKQKTPNPESLWESASLPESGAVPSQLIRCHLLLKSQLGRPAGAGFSLLFLSGTQNIVCSCWTRYPKYLMSLSEHIFSLLHRRMFSRWFVAC